MLRRVTQTFERSLFLVATALSMAGINTSQIRDVSGSPLSALSDDLAVLLRSLSSAAAVFLRSQSHERPRTPANTA